MADIDLRSCSELAEYALRGGCEREGGTTAATPLGGGGIDLCVACGPIIGGGGGETEGEISDSESGSVSASSERPSSSEYDDDEDDGSDTDFDTESDPEDPSSYHSSYSPGDDEESAGPRSFHLSLRRRSRIRSRNRRFEGRLESMSIEADVGRAYAAVVAISDSISSSDPSSALRAAVVVSPSREEEVEEEEREEEAEVGREEVTAEDEVGNGIGVGDRRARDGNTFYSSDGARATTTTGAAAAWSAEREAAKEGLVTAVLSQLEYVVCRVAYVTGPGDPLPIPTTAQSEATATVTATATTKTRKKRLTPNSRDVGDGWLRRPLDWDARGRRWRCSGRPGHQSRHCRHRPPRRCTIF